MSDIVETIESEEEKKRFLSQLKASRAAPAFFLIAERIFRIENFQRVQNHNSSQILKRTRRLEVTLLVLTLLGVKQAFLAQVSLNDLLKFVTALLGIQ